MSDQGAGSRTTDSGLGALPRPGVPMNRGDEAGPAGRSEEERLHRLAEPLRYCLQPRLLRRTVLIALVVGLLLTAVNQLDVIVSGEATTTTWLRSALNFVIPFLVANVGLLSARREASR
jgi:hypothetical protein